MIGKIRQRSSAAHLINYLLQPKQEAATPLVVAFDMAMELVLQPNVAQTAGGGGGDNSCETEDERKRKRNGGDYKPKFHR